MKMVKNLIMMVPAAMTLAACDGWNKSPSADLETIRAQSKVVKAQNELGPDKPREITNTVVVEKQVEVVRQETTIDANFLNIIPDSVMTFSEGQTASFKIRAFVTIPGATIKLSASGLPEGATIEASKTEKDIYVLSWTPSLYTVSSNQMVKAFTVKVTASIASTGQAKNPDAVKGLTKEVTIPLFVSRNQEAPSALTVDLKTEVSEDALTPFTVVVKVPGIDGKTADKPRLAVTYDGVKVTAGNSFQERDGSRFVTADIKNKEPQYLGDSKWKFSLVFDTKNISVLPQLAKDGSIMQTADGARVRFSVKAFNPSGLATPESLVQVKIRYTKSITAPRFDVSGLAKQALEVSNGETVTLKFSASSADKEAVVKVESKNSTLAGNPQVSCADATTGSNKQECTLTWTVPCDAAAASLTGSVDMTATSTVNGRISDVTAYSLKTVKAATDKGLCKTEAPKADVVQTEAK